jgi:hypothetical protein
MLDAFRADEVVIKLESRPLVPAEEEGIKANEFFEVVVTVRNRLGMSSPSSNSCTLLSRREEDDRLILPLLFFCLPHPSFLPSFIFPLSLRFPSPTPPLTHPPRPSHLLPTPQRKPPNMGHPPGLTRPSPTRLDYLRSILPAAPSFLLHHHHRAYALARREPFLFAHFQLVFLVCVGRPEDGHDQGVGEWGASGDEV